MWYLVMWWSHVFPYLEVKTFVTFKIQVFWVVTCWLVNNYWRFICTDALWCSEMSVAICQSLHLQEHCCVNLNSCTSNILWRMIEYMFHAYTGCASDILSEYTLFFLASKNSDFTVQYDWWISVVLCVISWMIRYPWRRMLLEKLNC